LQLVNGLDSTGFGAARWIAAGHQSRFEGVRAEDLAVVGRVDVDSIFPGFLVGTSIYAGSTTGNRPRDDLNVDGTIVIGSANFRYWGRQLKTQGAVYLGHLDDAEEISDRNSRLSNSLGVDRTPVADGAFGFWTEIGYNISPLISLEVANGKIADPFDQRDPNIVESQFSGNSLADFANNIMGSKNAYTIAVANLVNAVNPVLDAQVQGAFLLHLWKTLVWDRFSTILLAKAVIQKMAGVSQSLEPAGWGVKLSSE